MDTIPSARKIADSDESPVTFALGGEGATLALGAALAALAQPGDVLALYGDLGMGKTTLARGFIRAVAGTGEEVPSPTFTLVQIYETPRLTVWHADLYRLTAPSEALELGLDDAFGHAVTLIEWPERLGGDLPSRRLDITLRQAPAGQRVATLIPHGLGWAERLAALPAEIRS